MRPMMRMGNTVIVIITTMILTTIILITVFAMETVIMFAGDEVDEGEGEG